MKMPTREDAEATAIRTWITENDIHYGIYCVFRDKNPAVSGPHEESATSPAGELTQATSELNTHHSVAGLTVTDPVDEAGPPPEHPQADIFSMWSRNPKVATRLPTSEKPAYDFVITLKEDSSFSNCKLDPSGNDVSARFTLPEGFSWTYKGGKVVSCAYPKDRIAWKAGDDVEAYDEEGAFCLASDEPWDPSYLKLHAHGDEVSDRASSRDAIAAGSSSVKQSGRDFAASPCPARREFPRSDRIETDPCIR